jgi:DNA-binding transcriptional MerR regulator
MDFTVMIDANVNVNQLIRPVLFRIVRERYAHLFHQRTSNRVFGYTPRHPFLRRSRLVSTKRVGANGHQRVYTIRDRTRLKLTLRGKRLGLTLSQIAELINMYESSKDTEAQLTRFINVLDDHKARLEQQLEDLKLTLSDIQEHRAHCSQLLSSLPISNDPNHRQTDVLAAA